ncbi:hypothetical protein, partial [Dickeya dadantii]|uniref:hypothetical protein n=1 Tax=Dickeya dadantii TaxID=204038 RepID=UPI001F15B748
MALAIRGAGEACQQAVRVEEKHGVDKTSLQAKRGRLSRKIEEGLKGEKKELPVSPVTLIV